MFKATRCWVYYCSTDNNDTVWDRLDMWSKNS